MDLGVLSDWRVLSLIAMAGIGAYSIAFRKFFEQGGDWRLFLPVAGLVGLLALAYFAYTYKDVKYTTSQLALLAVILVSIGIAALASIIVYATPSAPISIAVPLMGLSILVTAVLAIFFLGESLSIRTWAGIILGLVAIVLLAFK